MPEGRGPAPPPTGGHRADRIAEGGHPSRAASAPQGAIEVLEIKPAVAAGTIRAFLTLRFGGITVYGAKIVQQPGQRAWLAMPSTQWTPPGGGKGRHYPTVELSESLRERACACALAAWEAHDGSRQ